MSHQNTPYGRLALRLFILLMLAALIAACDNKNKDSVSSRPAVTTVKIYLEAPQIEYAGIYAAISQGYFADEKLDVELIFSMTDSSSTLDNAAVEAVMSNAPVFTDMAAETLLTSRQNGEDMVAVLTLYERDARSIISNTNKGISVPTDLVGKRLLVLPSDELMTTVFLREVGVNLEDVILVRPTADQGIDAILTEIMGGEVDGYINSIEVATQLGVVGFPATRLAFNDYGVQSYHNLMVTSRQMITENPDVVQHFVNAVLRGLQYSLKQPKEVAAWFVQTYGSQLHVVQLRAQEQAIRSIVPLMQIASSNPGMMTAQTWDFTAELLKKYDLLDASVAPNEAYTMQFLDAYYK